MATPTVFEIDEKRVHIPSAPLTFFLVISYLWAFFYLFLNHVLLLLGRSPMVEVKLPMQTVTLDVLRVFISNQ
jgi:hypothetical protein